MVSPNIHLLGYSEDRPAATDGMPCIEATAATTDSREVIFGFCTSGGCCCLEGSPFELFVSQPISLESLSLAKGVCN